MFEVLPIPKLSPYEAFGTLPSNDCSGRIKLPLEQGGTLQSTKHRNRQAMWSDVVGLLKFVGNSSIHPRVALAPTCRLAMICIFVVQEGHFKLTSFCVE